VANDDSDLASVQSSLKDVNVSAQSFGKVLTSAFASGVTGGKSLDDTLKNVGQRLSDLALKSALKPVSTGISSLATGLFSGLFGSGSDSSSGGLFSSLFSGLKSVTPFAEGGVISTPSYFPLGGGLGLAGEAGTEAILPLSRGSDGSLGVAANGMGQPLSMTVNISTPDADSFRRSEAQVTASLARAVLRGQRAM
jgi:phage-related minor tail protein